MFSLDCPLIPRALDWPLALPLRISLALLDPPDPAAEPPLDPPEALPDPVEPLDRPAEPVVS
jgi:hypothetical protein